MYIDLIIPLHNVFVAFGDLTWLEWFQMLGKAEAPYRNVRPNGPKYGKNEYLRKNIWVYNRIFVRNLTNKQTFLGN